MLFPVLGSERFANRPKPAHVLRAGLPASLRLHDVRSRKSSASSIR